MDDRARSLDSYWLIEKETRSVRWLLFPYTRRLGMDWTCRRFDCIDVLASCDFVGLTNGTEPGARVYVSMGTYERNASTEIIHPVIR